MLPLTLTLGSCYNGFLRGAARLNWDSLPSSGQISQRDSLEVWHCSFGTLCCSLRYKRGLVAYNVVYLFTMGFCSQLYFAGIHIFATLG